MSGPASAAGAADIAPAIPALLLGLICAIRPQWPIRVVAAGIAWQRRNIADPSLGLQERIVHSRVTFWFVRLFGAALVLGFVLSLTGGGEGR